MEKDAEVVIIGGGIVGCTAAYFLAKKGVPAVLCEKGEIAGEQSSRNWGFVRQQGRDPAELPLMIECNRMWQGFERELDADLEWHQGGNIVLGYDEARMAEFESWVEIARQHQLHSRVVSRQEVLALIPGIETEAVGALYTPGDGQAEPARVSLAFQAAAERLGARIHIGCAVEGIELEGGAVAGVVTERGPIRTRTVVCAAGAWASRLARTVGVALPQLWMRGTVARTTPVRPITRAGVWSHVAFRQRRDGTLNIASGFGADHDLMVDSLRGFAPFLPAYRLNRSLLKLKFGRAFFEDLGGIGAGFRDFRRRRVLDPPPNPRRTEEAFGALKRSFANLGDVSVTRSWAGYIDFTPDMIPVIERLDRPAGFILAAGLSGHGFGLGPMVGRLVAEMVADGAPSLDLSAFRLARFRDGSARPPQNVV